MIGWSFGGLFVAGRWCVFAVDGFSRWGWRAATASSVVIWLRGASPAASSTARRWGGAFLGGGGSCAGAETGEGAAAGGVGGVEVGLGEFVFAATGGG